MTQMEMLKKVAAGELKPEEAAKAMATSRMSLKVSEKGCISVYGLRRMPITLYVKEMEAVLDNSDRIRKFITDNDSKLSRKTPA